MQVLATLVASTCTNDSSPVCGAVLDADAVQSVDGEFASVRSGRGGHPGMSGERIKYEFL